MQLRFFTLFLSHIVSTIFLLVTQYATAQTHVTSPHVTVDLIQKTVGCAATTDCTFGFRFILDEGWHVYWKNPGDSGAAPKFKFIEPSSLSTTPHGHDLLQWPIPKKLPLAHLVNFGYEDEVVLSFTVPKALIAEQAQRTQLPTLKLYIEGEWLVCKEDCIPGMGSFTLTVPLNSTAARSASPDAHFFDEQHLPRTTTSGHYTIADQQLILTLPSPIPSQLELFPVTPGLITNTHLPSISIEQEQTLLSIQSKHSSVSGPITFLIKQNDQQADEITFLSQTDTTTAPLSALTPQALVIALASALLGGLLLNLMPCVFPVLGLKVLSAIKTIHQQHAAKSLHIALSFLAGVCVSLWIFLIIIFSLRTTGTALGWGFQLQNPYMVAFLLVLFVVLTLNLLGFFEIQSSVLQSIGQKLHSRSVIVEHFLSGLLTVLVATPCTAPFMGAALGVALAQSMLEAFLIFTALGIGISLPFMLLVTIPTLRAILPRPGTWMIWLRRLLAVPCFITACWLGWVLWLQTMPPSQIAAQDSYGLTWIPYSEQTVATLQSQQRTIYLDFTAAWCISCQVNKALVFGDSDIQKLIKDKNIALVRADWTNQDLEITKALARYGKAGVPLNVVYTPKQAPQVLPTLLTASLVRAALDR